MWERTLATSGWFHQNYFMAEWSRAKTKRAGTDPARAWRNGLFNLRSGWPDWEGRCE
jgi:hypothetical protein